jgi:hypothetical protein
MGVLHVEDLASHDDPESCDVIRKGGGEALTGESAGRVLSRVKLNIQGADAVEKSGRQHGVVRQGEHHSGPARSKTSCTHGSHLHGNREVPWTAVAALLAAARIGKGAPVIR